MDKLVGCRSFYVEFTPGESQGGIADSMFVLRDAGLITGPGQHLFASPYSSLLFVIPDGHAPFIRFVAAQKDARTQKRALHGWAFGIRFCSHWHSRYLEQLALNPQFRSEVTTQLLNALQTKPSIEHLQEVLQQLLSRTCRELPALPSRSASPSASSSSRTRRRHSVREFGMSPKALSSLFRFQKLVPRVVDADATLVDLASSHAYSDQAHLTRDFVRRAGVSPGRFRQRWSGRGDVRFFQDQSQGGVVRFGLAIY